MFTALHDDKADLDPSGYTFGYGALKYVDPSATAGQLRGVIASSRSFTSGDPLKGVFDAASYGLILTSVIGISVLMSLSLGMSFITSIF